MIWIILLCSLIMMWLDYRATQRIVTVQRVTLRRRLLTALWLLDLLPQIYWLLTNELLWRDNPTWMVVGSMWIYFIYMITVIARGPLMLALAYTQSIWWRVVSAFLGIFLICQFVYGMAVTRTDYAVRHVILRSERLPASFDGYRILHFSDLHVASLVNPKREVADIVNICNAQQADMIAFSGDLINVRHSELTPQITDLLAALQAEDGVFAVTGNHDRGVYVRDSLTITTAYTTSQVIATEKEMGWQVLDNDTQYIHRGKDSIAITGISFSAQLQDARHSSNLPEVDISKAYGEANKGDFNITIAHIPQLWDRILDEGYADLTLSGHTHAMQIKIPVGRRGISPSRLLYKRWSGLYEKRNRWLYINDGIGLTLYPMRLGAPPEITIIELHCK
ncbi:MAG: metallophosphoesterase [Rikenellaceae bacterium]|nr:metallophosphoesterase [Rikenellaceae bacterium]